MALVGMQIQSGSSFEYDSIYPLRVSKASIANANRYLKSEEALLYNNSRLVQQVFEETFTANLDSITLLALLRYYNTEKYSVCIKKNNTYYKYTSVYIRRMVIKGVVNQLWQVEISFVALSCERGTDGINYINDCGETITFHSTDISLDSTAVKCNSVVITIENMLNVAYDTEGGTKSTAITYIKTAVSAELIVLKWTNTLLDLQDNESIIPLAIMLPDAFMYFNYCKIISVDMNALEAKISLAIGRKFPTMAENCFVFSLPSDGSISSPITNILTTRTLG
jgi:hypothetical protein